MTTTMNKIADELWLMIFQNRANRIATSLLWKAYEPSLRCFHEAPRLTSLGATTNLTIDVYRTYSEVPTPAQLEFGLRKIFWQLTGGNLRYLSWTSRIPEHDNIIFGQGGLLARLNHLNIQSLHLETWSEEWSEELTDREIDLSPFKRINDFKWQVTNESSLAVIDPVLQNNEAHLRMLNLFAPFGTKLHVDATFFIHGETEGYMHRFPRLKELILTELDFQPTEATDFGRGIEVLELLALSECLNPNMLMGPLADCGSLSQIKNLLVECSGLGGLGNKGDDEDMELASWLFLMPQLERATITLWTQHAALHAMGKLGSLPLKKLEIWSRHAGRDVPDILEFNAVPNSLVFPTRGWYVGNEVVGVQTESYRLITSAERLDQTRLWPEALGLTCRLDLDILLHAFVHLGHVVVRPAEDPTWLNSAAQHYHDDDPEAQVATSIYPEFAEHIPMAENVLTFNDLLPYFQGDTHFKFNSDSDTSNANFLVFVRRLFKEINIDCLMFGDCTIRTSGGDSYKMILARDTQNEEYGCSLLVKGLDWRYGNVMGRYGALIQLCCTDEAGIERAKYADLGESMTALFTE